MLIGNFRVEVTDKENLESIVDQLENYLFDLRKAKFPENFPNSDNVSFYLEEE